MKKKMHLISITIAFFLLTSGSALHAFECVGPDTANCLQCHVGGDIHTFHLGDIVPLDNCTACHCGQPGVSACDDQGLTHEPVEALCCIACHDKPYEVRSHISRGGDCLSCHPQKIGVLLITGGISDEYAHEWRVGFYDHLFPAWPAGFLAGGPKEGATCYTVIHYANEAEAFICGVAEGTPIDAFCNEYTGSYPVHSLHDHWPGAGDGTFFDDCFPQILPAAVFTGSHSTIDPVTLEVIEGPHIDDPLGSGIGVSDFTEIGSFNFMESLYRFPDNRNPSHQQDLKWFYGNDTPGFLGYPPDTPELTNIKDELAGALPGVTFVLRHGSEGYMKNLDAYGNPSLNPESTETAIDELIHDEHVDGIVVFVSAPDNSNLTRFGPCWRDENGVGISSVPNQTYKQCLDNLEDGVGPTQEKLEAYYAAKPWEELLKITFPEIEHLAHETDPTVDLAFTRGLNEMEEFELAVLDMLNYTISKYSIPDTASLKVIVAGHGLSDGWNDALACDSYDRMINDIFDRLVTRIEMQHFPNGYL